MTALVNRFQSGYPTSEHTGETYNGIVDPLNGLLAGVGGSIGTPFSTEGSQTLTAAEILTGMIICTTGAGANTAFTLPTAAAMIAAMQALAPHTVLTAGNFFDFSIINTSVTGGETDSVVTATGWTLTGVMTQAITTSARFRAVITSIASATMTLYRIA